MTKHSEIVGREVYAGPYGEPHVVAFLEEGSVYLLVNCETGAIPVWDDTIVAFEEKMQVLIDMA